MWTLSCIVNICAICFITHIYTRLTIICFLKRHVVFMQVWEHSLSVHFCSLHPDAQSSKYAWLTLLYFCILCMQMYWLELFVEITVPVATFVMAVICGTDKLRCDLFLNMLLVSIGVVVSSYGEIHFNIVGTVYQVTGIFAEALRLVLTQVLLQKKGLTLNPITSLYYIAPCRYVIDDPVSSSWIILLSCGADE